MEASEKSVEPAQKPGGKVCLAYDHPCGLRGRVGGVSESRNKIENTYKHTVLKRNCYVVCLYLNYVLKSIILNDETDINL